MKNNPFYEQSESIKDLLAALQDFKSEVGKVLKTDTNPHFKSKYAGLSTILDTIEEPMRKNGLLLLQKLSGDNVLTTTIYHVYTGEYISNSLNMIIAKPDAQGFGSAVTYYKRYSIVSLLSLNVDDDDDGEMARKKAISAAVAEIKASTSREMFVAAQKKFYAYKDEQAVNDALVEMSKIYPKQ